MRNLLSELWNGLSIGVEMSELDYALNSQSEHKKIYAALEARDAMAARAEMEMCIRDSCGLNRKFYKQLNSQRPIYDMQFTVVINESNRELRWQGASYSGAHPVFVAIFTIT